MTILITLTTAGANTGPFLIYTNVDGFTVPVFETSISREDLEAGFSSSAFPEGTTTIRLVSVGVCENFIDIEVESIITTTTTTTAEPTTTTTTTVEPTTTTTTTTINYVVMQLESCGECIDQPATAYVVMLATTPLGTVVRTSDLYCWTVFGPSEEPVDNTFLEEFVGTCKECQAICPVVEECYSYRLTYDASGGEVNYIDCTGNPQNIVVFGVVSICARSITSTVPAGEVVIANVGTGCI